MRRLLDRLRNERGIALVMALVVMLVLTTSIGTVIAFTSSGQRHASYSKDSQLSYSLAEAGLNNAMSVLANPANNAADPYVFCTDGEALAPTQPYCTRRTDYTQGYVLWTGTLDTSAYVWTLTSTGYVKNPTKATANIVRRVTAKVGLEPRTTQPLSTQNQAFNYIYSTKTGDPDGCDMELFNDVVVGTRMYVNGNLCLHNQSVVSTGPLNVKGRVTLNTNDTRIGSSSNQISNLNTAVGCKWRNNALHSPCLKGAAPSYDNVWYVSTSSTVDTISPPTSDWRAWYLNSNPGPYYPCTTVTGTPPTLDTPVNTTPNATDDAKHAYRDGNQGVQNLAPTSSYTCRTKFGELSWNASTKTLTVSGTIFIDGSATIENNSVNRYTGQGTIYLEGTFLLRNSRLCAVVNSSGTGCNNASGVWKPNERLLVIAANRSGGQVPSGTSIHIVSSEFQGALYATSAVQLDTSAQVNGPIVGAEVKLGNSVDTYNFDTMITVPAGLPGETPAYPKPTSPYEFSG